MAFAISTDLKAMNSPVVGFLYATPAFAGAECRRLGFHARFLSTREVPGCLSLHVVLAPLFLFLRYVATKFPEP